MNNSEFSSGKHRLAAIMFLDMVGYSALMSKSESNALKCIKKLEEILKSNVPNAGGRLVKFLGDGSMAEFPTALSAVSCAKKVLDEIAKLNAELPETERFNVRIGIHLGDVVEEKGDLFGDAVNIAARVQPLADPGGMALTDVVHSQIKNKMSLRGTYIPWTKLKNIPGRTKIFIVSPPGTLYPLWALGKRKPTLAIATAIVLFIAIAGVGAWFASYRNTPQRLALLYIRSQTESANMAQLIEEEINHSFSSISGIEWIDHLGMLDLFSEVGVKDLHAIEELETSACKAARQGGLDYSLVGQLKSLGENRWQLDSKIICTSTRSVVGTFSIEGTSVQNIVSNLQSQIQDWIKENL
ncbi:MAG: adenylate/guanylate cyclase domain-containing protein [Candidatus Dadabacteria bacterium]|nr:adenylate/guanylate cyclase domain-containing protein [Candidatus Dadabacteria bacterium]